MTRGTTFRELLRLVLPPFVWLFLRRIYYRLTGGRPGESYCARKRRIREGFFRKYCQGRGIDIGCGKDKLSWRCKGWDFEEGDAQYLVGIADRSYDFVYSSHALEHMVDAAVALSNWWRILKPAGFLLLYVPHRDLYEKRTTLPSKWNVDHKRYFLVDGDDPPCTLGIVPLINRTLDGAEIVYAKTCSEGHTITDPNLHSDGEYSIEVVVRKRPALPT